MYGCISNSTLTMTAEVLYQISGQDEQTNAIVRRWTHLKNIKCNAQSIKETGASVISDNKSSGMKFQEDQEIKIFTSERLSKRWRISSIKNSHGTSLFTEIDRVSSPDTIFEVYASKPVFDMFGNVSYYDNHLRRVTVQSND